MLLSYVPILYKYKRNEFYFMLYYKKENENYYATKPNNFIYVYYTVYMMLRCYRMHNIFLFYINEMDAGARAFFFFFFGTYNTLWQSFKCKTKTDNRIALPNRPFFMLYCTIACINMRILNEKKNTTYTYIII